MIVKELDHYQGDDKLAKAGYEAEKQMAHYLLRQFHNDNNLFVINTLGRYTKSFERLVPDMKEG